MAGRWTCGTRGRLWSDDVCAILEVPPGFRPAWARLSTSELQVITVHGRRVWVHAVGAIRDAHGRIVRLEGAFQDLSS